MAHPTQVYTPFASSTIGEIGNRVSSKSKVNSPNCLTLGFVEVAVASSSFVSACSLVDTRDNRCGTKASVKAIRHTSTCSAVFIVVFFACCGVHS